MKEEVFKFSHTSQLADSEPKWGTVDKTSLPRLAHAETGDPDNKSTWKYPHHWISGGADKNDAGVYTSGKMYLHKGGLNAAWAAANGARSGNLASDAVLSHIRKHRTALGLNEKAELESMEDTPFEVVKQDEEHQIVYGVVYTADRIDTDWETITEEDVQKMCWNFLSTGKINNIDIQHNLLESGCYVVESFMTREGDPDFPEKSWVLGVKCTDEIWDSVKKGELNGFSFYGKVQKYPAKVLLEVAKQITGITEKSTADIVPEHEHAFLINFDAKGKIVSGKTDIVQGHSHAIQKGTACEIELDHSHRIDLE